MFHLKISWRFIKEALIQPEAEVGAPDSQIAGSLLLVMVLVELQNTSGSKVGGR